MVLCECLPDHISKTNRTEKRVKFFFLSVGRRGREQKRKFLLVWSVNKMKKRKKKNYRKSFDFVSWSWGKSKRKGRERNMSEFIEKFRHIME